MTTRRSVGKMQISRAVWYVRPGVVELRMAPLVPPKPGEARVRTLWSGVSRGTERLVSGGLVPESEWQRMRAPLQDGAFPFPVKYGYCATGVVEDGPEELLGRNVFCLAPHQDHFVAPVAMLTPIPDGVPVRRASLAANMETALNAHWDAGTGPGDRITVVGAGIVGLLVASIAARLPGAEVTVIDTDESRRELVEALGARFLAPSPGSSQGVGIDADVVFHTSATAAGLRTAIACAGTEARVVELSWYGDKEITVPLGGPFHSRRLQIVSSQVGQVAASRRPRWPYARRLQAALAMLADEVFDRFVTDEIAFDDTPKRLPALLAPDARGLAPVIRYPGA